MNLKKILARAWLTLLVGSILCGVFYLMWEAIGWRGFTVLGTLAAVIVATWKSIEHA